MLPFSFRLPETFPLALFWWLPSSLAKISRLHQALGSPV